MPDRRSQAWPVAIFLCGAVALTGVLAFQKSWIRLPPNSLPWKPPDLTKSPGIWAHLQINAVARNGPQCRKVLDAAGLAYTPMKDRRIDDHCGFTDAVRFAQPPIVLHPEPAASCGLAAALIWYQQQLQPSAEQILHTRIASIDQLGTFSCRNVNSERSGPRSEHATANAIDIAAFRLADGRVVSVSEDWNAAGPKGQFLKTAHDEACRVFNGVLGPDYNRLHANHFHLDLGPYLICS